MFKKLTDKLAALGLAKKVLIAVVTVALVSGATIYGLSQYTNAPDIQDPQGTQQQQQQKPEQEDDILDIEDVEEEEESGVKKTWKKVKKTITGTAEEETPEVRYIVLFETNGGGEICGKSVAAGTGISRLPTPKKDGYIFLGWCYDKDLTREVKSTDGVYSDLTLYASWLEQAPLETLQKLNFTAAENVGADFAIRVLSSDSALTAEDVKAAITAKNLTNPEIADVISVTAENGGFVIRGVKHFEGIGTIPGFEEGATYTIRLESDALTFEGCDENVREYNLTTQKQEVLNVQLNGDITYIPASDLENIVNDGQAVSTLDIAFYTVGNDGAMSAAELTSGTFDYTKGTLRVGQIVSVYDGLIPTERTLQTPEDQLGDIGYVEITGVSGSTYGYKNAQVEDVVFTPDMLPMPESADLDTTDGAVITVEDRYFDYSADLYAQMDLDSQTKVEKGDYLVFYTGDLAVTSGENAAVRTGFAEITSVTNNGNGTTTVAYRTVSWDEVDSSMDVYTQDEVTADEMLEGINKEEIEAEIEQQAMDSGFAEEAAQYLASLALATENFTKLADNMNLEDYKVQLTDGTPVTPEQLSLMDSGISARTGGTMVKASVSKKPKHLGNVAGTDADKEGLAITLEVTTVITIDAEEGQLEITVTGKFVEEIGFDYGASSDTEWDWWGIIPYISEWTVSANVDLINYTGLEIEALMVTQKSDYISQATNVAEDIKELLANNTNPETGDDHHTQLIEKYSEIVNADSDWIRIVDINICKLDQRLPPALPIIHLEFTTNFVIDMDASVAVGFEFEYLEGKRYIFNVRITEGKITSSEVSLKEKTYELSFYTMGRIAVRAGVELDFRIGLFDTSVANIGFSAAAGPYTKLYGYFYYELRYAESSGRTQSYSGALLTQVGVYFNLSLHAEAIGGKLAAEHDLVDKEWLLWEAGRRDNVLDFVTEQEDMPEVIMRQYVRRMQLPDSVFNMTYLDLITGDGKNAVYNDWEDPAKEGDFRNGENYVITFTNDKFTYDPTINEIYVKVDEGDIKIEGEMIITWKKQPMSFSSKPLQRRIRVYWDKLRDGYMIVPYTNGGSYVPIIVKKYEAKVTAPADPEKLGYVFEGWFSDEALTVPYTFPEKMPNKDANIYAKWQARTDIPYTVEHYLEDFRSGEYELFETETLEGTTDTYVTPAVKDYEGYISPSAQEIKIWADGSTTLRYYYKLHRSTVTFNSGLEGKENSSYSLKYGATIVAPQMTAKGYTFAGWRLTDGDTTVVIPAKEMGTQDLSYTAMWTLNEDTEYRVEYYVEQTDGSYKLQHFFTEKGITGAVINEADLRNVTIDGVTADVKYTDGDGITPENMTVKGIVCENGKAVLTGDGKMVVKINYARTVSALTFDPAHDDAQPTVTNLYYQQTVAEPQNPTRVGYTFAGWDDTATAEEVAVTPITTMPEYPVTYKALWTPNPDTKYTVRHHQQNVDDLTKYTHKDTDNLTGTTATSVTPDVKTYEGFTSPVTQTAVIAPDGSMVVDYYYTRNEYTVTLEAAGGAFVEESDEPTEGTTPEGGTEGTAPEGGTEGTTPEGGTEGTTPEDGTEGTAPEGGEETTPPEDTTPPVTSVTLTFIYGESLELPTPSREGYAFSGWNKGETSFAVGTQPAEDLVLTAQWAADQFGYTVNHRLQNVDGSENYTIAGVDNLTADMDSDVTPAVKEYTGFTSPELKTITIRASARLNVIDYYYTRNQYTLSWDFNTGSAEGQTYTDGTVYFDAAVTAPVPVKTGYSYVWTDAETAQTVTPVTFMPAADTAYKAVWTPNQYKVNFVVNGGVVATPEGETAIPVTERLVTFDTAYGPLAELEKTGYIFDGWFTEPTGGTQVTADTILKTAADHTLYAHYTLITHDISYRFIDSNLKVEVAGVSNTENPAFYSVEAHEFVLANPSADGYTFKGWYLGYENGQFTNPISGTVDFAAYHGQTFYAELEPANYTIAFYQGTENENPATHKLYFGETVGLEYYSTNIRDNKAGYTLLGWTTEEGGTTVQYGMTDTVSNLTTVDKGTVKLYAVWKLDVYTIGYNMGKHTTDTDASYVKSFSIESEGDIILPTPKAKTNFAFGGWYTDAAYTSRVTTISKLSKENYTLYAKWEHGGEFEIAYTSKSNGKAKFTITRTIPDGAEASQAVQTVYVRTLNGTAYATTLEVASGTGQDKYHFIHNQAAIAFTSDMDEAIFEVVEKDDRLNDNFAASFQIGGKKRVYYADIYKIVSTQGGLVGKVKTKTATRTMAVSSYKLTTDFYRWFSDQIAAGPVTVNDDGYDAHTKYTVKPWEIYKGSSDEQLYRDAVSEKYSYYVTYDVIEKDDCYQWFRLSTVDPSNKVTIRGDYIFATKHEELAENWRNGIHFPRNGTASQGDVRFNVGDCKVSEGFTMYNDNDITYAVIGAKNRVRLEFDSSGKKGSDEWQYRNLNFYVKVHDKSKPAVKYVAPLAVADINQGETINLTVIYSEPINSIGGNKKLTLSSRLNKYFESPTYVELGSGTNAVVFQVKAKTYISADTVQDVINQYLAYPESDYKDDGFGTNIGTLSITVKDILGNG